MLHSKVEVLEKRDSEYSEASFKNSLKNDKAKKKSKKKSDDDDDKDLDEETPYEELTDEEKDARDYQLQRAMEMVIAMDKLKSRSITSPTDVKAEK